MLEFVHTFEDIVRGDRTVHRVAEDERHIAFLEATPVRPGHVVVFQKSVTDQLFEMQPEAYGALMEFARATAAHMKTALPCRRVCMAVIGWQVRHAHVHLVPTDAIGEFTLQPGTPADETQLLAMAQRLGRGRS